MILILNLQDEWDCIKFPHGMSGKPRDPFHYIKDYKMEEVAMLLWIFGIAASHATPEWLELWQHLRDACTHYLYGFSATEQQCREGHNHLCAYAECVENAVKMGLVSYSGCSIFINNWCTSMRVCNFRIPHQYHMCRFQILYYLPIYMLQCVGYLHRNYNVVLLLWNLSGIWNGVPFRPRVF